MFEKEAEEYAKSIVIFDRDFHNDRFAELEQAFLAGLKAGRPKWHKVADGDLPKEDSLPRTYGYYLTASRHKAYKGFVFEVAYFTGTVFTRDGQIGDNVVAWKEIIPPELKEIE